MMVALSQHRGVQVLVDLGCRAHQRRPGPSWSCAPGRAVPWRPGSRSRCPASGTRSGRSAFDHVGRRLRGHVQAIDHGGVVVLLLVERRRLRRCMSVGDGWEVSASIDGTQAASQPSTKFSEHQLEVDRKLRWPSVAPGDELNGCGVLPRFATHPLRAGRRPLALPVDGGRFRALVAAPGDVASGALASHVTFLQGAPWPRGTGVVADYLLRLRLQPGEVLVRDHGRGGRTAAGDWTRRSGAGACSWAWCPILSSILATAKANFDRSVMAATRFSSLAFFPMA